MMHGQPCVRQHGTAAQDREVARVGTPAAFQSARVHAGCPLPRRMWLWHEPADPARPLIGRCRRISGQDMLNAS